MSDDLTNRKISLWMQGAAEALDGAIEERFGKGLCFALLIFGPGRLQYVSNGNRKDMTEAFENLLDRWRSQQHVDLPHHIMPTVNISPEDWVQLPDGTRRSWRDVQHALLDFDARGGMLS